MKKNYFLRAMLLCMMVGMMQSPVWAANQQDFAKEEAALLGTGMHMGERTGAGEWLKKGDAFADNKQFDLAVEAYTKALALKKEFSSAYFKRAEAQFALKKYELAQADYTQVIQLQSGYLNAYFKRAICWYYLKEYQKGLDDTEILLNLQPKHGSAYLIQAVCQQKLGQKEQAIATYQKILRVVPAGQKEVIKTAKKMLQELGANEQS